MEIAYRKCEGYRMSKLIIGPEPEELARYGWIRQKYLKRKSTRYLYCHVFRWNFESTLFDDSGAGGGDCEGGDYICLG